MGVAAGQPGPQMCLMELKVAPVLHRQVTWLLIPLSQQTSLVPSCGIPSSSSSLAQSKEWGLALKKESKSLRDRHATAKALPILATKSNILMKAQPSTGPSNR